MFGFDTLRRVGAISVHARGGYEYFITFTDDYSRYGYLYLMKKKFEALDKFKEFKAKSYKQLERRIKSLCSDRGGEYISIEFISFLKKHGILYLNLILQELHKNMEWQKEEIEL